MKKSILLSFVLIILMAGFSAMYAQDMYEADLEILPGNELYEVVPNGDTFKIKAQITNHGPDDIPENVIISFDILNSTFGGWGLPTGLNVGDSTEVMGLVSNINNNTETDTLEICVVLLYNASYNQINDPNSANDTACNYLILEGQAVSIHENTKEAFASYPNPFNEKLTLDFKDKKLQNAHIVIYDVLGKEVLRKDIENQEKIEIPTANWNKGMYFIEMQGLDERINWKVLKE